MVALEEFQADVETGLEAEVVGFDISIILLTLLPVLVEQLQVCLGGDDVASKLSQGGLWARIQTQRALRQVLRESGDKMSLSDQSKLTSCCVKGFDSSERNTKMMQEVAQMRWSLA